MGQRFETLSEKHINFISEQKLFFVATCTSNSRINLSPKGMDTFKVINPNRAVWLNLTGSGNETSAHIQADSRMTIMFISFEGDPIILRLYGNAKVIHKKDREWETLSSNFNYFTGSRQIFDVSIDLVQKSCGFGIPLYDYVEDRTTLNDWSSKIGEDGIIDYWKSKNTTSLDGNDTNIIEKNI